MTEPKMEIAAAMHLAAGLLAQMEGICIRAGVVGSVRRRKKQVKDIELLVEPATLGDLLGNETPQVEPIDALVRAWHRGGDALPILGGGPKAKYIRVQHVAGVQIDVFIVTPPADWACQAVIRTGPANLSKLLVTRLRRRGMRMEGGRILTEHGERVLTPTEHEVFAAAGIPYAKATERDALLESLTSGAS